MNELFQIISTLTPVLIAIIGLIIVLARMHYNLESLAEKVKVLFDFHNKRKR